MAILRQGKRVEETIQLFAVERMDIIQLLDKGVVEYHFYSDETRNIRRGRRPSWIFLGEAE